MNPEEQKGRARKQHMNAMEAGNTCIDCHKGIAHKPVHDLLTDEELDVLERPDPANKRPIAAQWLATAKPEKAEAVPEQAAVAVSGPAPEAPAEAARTEKTAPVAAAAATGDSFIDWSAVPDYEVTLFYPGQSSMEWVLNGRDHGGARPLKAGDRCFDCHEGEEADIGELVVSGEKLEPNPIPGKRGSIVMNVRAAHDSDNLYLRFQWDDGEHAPVPFADGGKMDPDNQVKLAVMLTSDDEKVEFAERSGCWQTCHHDARSMPDTPDSSTLAGSPLAQRLDISNGVTKYLKESRTAIEIKGKEGKPRGGWDKLKDANAIAASLADGQFMDLLRFNSGGESEDGYILAERVMSGGQGVSFRGALEDGVWTVEMKRKLTSDQPGDISLSVDEWYNIGFAIHDDYSSARYHHVSLGFKLGFDDEDAEINAIGK
jgi:cytochrome c-type protein NapC